MSKKTNMTEVAEERADEERADEERADEERADEERAGEERAGEEGAGEERAGEERSLRREGGVVLPTSAPASRSRSIISSVAVLPPTIMRS